MALNTEEGYLPHSDFQEDAREPLLDLSPSDSTELWLIQWPKSTEPDFEGQEIKLKLHKEGTLGSFNGSSGKEYEVVGFSSLAPENATVFVSSAEGTKVAGKISQRVSLVHYSEPHELEKHTVSNLKKFYQQSSSIGNTSGTPTQSSRLRSSRSTSKRPSSTHSSKRMSSLSDVGEALETPKKRHVAEPSRSGDYSTHSSGRGHSGVTYSGSSHEAKSKTRKNPVE